MITRYNSSLRWTYRNLLKIELAVIRTPFTTARSGELNFWISSGSKLSHLSGKSTVAIRLIVSDICAWIWGGTVHINSTRWFLTVTRSWAEMTIPFLSSSYVQLWYKKIGENAELCFARSRKSWFLLTSFASSHPLLTRFLKWTAAACRTAASAASELAIRRRTSREWPGFFKASFKCPSAASGRKR